jgi:hypothetical protein
MCQKLAVEEESQNAVERKFQLAVERALGFVTVKEEFHQDTQEERELRALVSEIVTIYEDYLEDEFLNRLLDPNDLFLELEV